MRARVARLRAELAPDREILETLGGLIADRAPHLAAADPATVALTATYVHRYYTALESTLQRIERTFAAEPSGGDWHLELLRGATLDLPGVRPPVLPAALLGDLREMLRFRHFFRHAYAVVSAAKLLELLSAHSPQGVARILNLEG
jgi:hypothetical protein